MPRSVPILTIRGPDPANTTIERARQVRHHSRTVAFILAGCRQPTKPTYEAALGAIGIGAGQTVPGIELNCLVRVDGAVVVPQPDASHVARAQAIGKVEVGLADAGAVSECVVLLQGIDEVSAGTADDRVFARAVP